MPNESSLLNILLDSVLKEVTEEEKGRMSSSAQNNSLYVGGRRASITSRRKSYDAQGDQQKIAVVRRGSVKRRMSLKKSKTKDQSNQKNINVQFSRNSPKIDPAAKNSELLDRWRLGTGKIIRDRSCARTPSPLPLIEMEQTDFTQVVSPKTGVFSRDPELPTRTLEQNAASSRASEPLQPRGQAQFSRPVHEQRLVYKYPEHGYDAEPLELEADDLRINSYFESGNLLQAERVYREAGRVESEEGALDSLPWRCSSEGQSVLDASRRKSDASVLTDASDIDSQGIRRNNSNISKRCESSCSNGERKQTITQEYNLLMHPDLLSKGHTQWFYFEVRNMRAGLPYRINITNFGKADSLYMEGMQPVLYSSKDASEFGIGWRRRGYDIWYYRNTMTLAEAQKHNNKKGKISPFLGGYCLTFTLEFPHDDDVCYLAYGHPYTYTDLQRYLQKQSLDEAKRPILRRREMCKTVAGNRCDLLTITNTTRGGNKLKKAIVISARVHPGESVSSWIMEGILDFLLSNTPSAFVLREHFVFKIVPMLNPDGVINGNYRCNLSGVDLNRQWHHPMDKIHPTIHALKKMLHKLQSYVGVGMYIDLHGHSRKKRCFIYGCLPEELSAVLQEAAEAQDEGGADVPAPNNQKECKDKMWSSSSEDGDQQRIDASNSSSMKMQSSRTSSMQSSRAGSNKRSGKKPRKKIRKGGGKTITSMNDPRLFPLILSKTSRSFSFASCTFNIGKGKECTARVIANQEIGIRNSYTLECSFCGGTTASGRQGQFQVSDLKSIGRGYCAALIDYFQLRDEVNKTRKTEKRPPRRRRRRCQPTASASTDRFVPSQPTPPLPLSGTNKGKSPLLTPGGSSSNLEKFIQVRDFNMKTTGFQQLKIKTAGNVFSPIKNEDGKPCNSENEQMFPDISACVSPHSRQSPRQSDAGDDLSGALHSIDGELSRIGFHINTICSEKGTPTMTPRNRKDSFCSIASSESGASMVSGISGFTLESDDESICSDGFSDVGDDGWDDEEELFGAISPSLKDLNLNSLLSGTGSLDLEEMNTGEEDLSGAGSDSDCGSDSDPSEGNLSDMERNLLLMKSVRPKADSSDDDETTRRKKKKKKRKKKKKYRFTQEVCSNRLYSGDSVLPLPKRSSPLSMAMEELSKKENPKQDPKAKPPVSQRSESLGLTQPTAILNFGATDNRPILRAQVFDLDLDESATQSPKQDVAINATETQCGITPVHLPSGLLGSHQQHKPPARVGLAKLRRSFHESLNYVSPTSPSQMEGESKNSEKLAGRHPVSSTGSFTKSKSFLGPSPPKDPPPTHSMIPQWRGLKNRNRSGSPSGLQAWGNGGRKFKEPQKSPSPPLQTATRKWVSESEASAKTFGFVNLDGSHIRPEDRGNGGSVDSPLPPRMPKPLKSNGGTSTLVNLAGAKSPLGCHRKERVQRLPWSSSQNRSSPKEGGKNNEFSNFKARQIVMPVFHHDGKGEHGSPRYARPRSMTHHHTKRSSIRPATSVLTVKRQNQNPKMK